VRIDCGVCVVRDFRPEDKTPLARHANNRSVWRNLTDAFPHPYSEADAERWIAYVGSQPEPTNWAIDVNGEAIGGIGVSLRDGMLAHTGEFGYWIGELFWGRGIGSAAAIAVAAYAFEWLKVRRLEAMVFAWNPVSMRILEKCGFVREGVMWASALKDGQIIDRVLYARVVKPLA